MLSTVTTKGQVTIPLPIREKFGLLPDTDIAFVVEGQTVRLVKTQRKERAEERSLWPVSAAVQTSRRPPRKSSLGRVEIGEREISTRRQQRSARYRNRRSG